MTARPKQLQPTSFKWSSHITQGRLMYSPYFVNVRKRNVKITTTIGLI